MKKYKVIIGIDVSKLKLDVTTMNATNSSEFVHQVFENTKKGITQMIRFVKKYTQSDPDSWLFCMEHTGVYTMPLSCFLSEHTIDYVLESAVLIQKSVGIKRGKNDKADSKDIARYAFLHQNEIECYRLPEKQLLKLKLLLSHRERLMKCKRMIEVSTKENALFLDKTLMSEIVKDSRSTLRMLERKLRQADQQLLQLIKADQQLKKACELVTSVPGVGLQTACHIIVFTRCFTSFSTAKQLACYAGIAPFEYGSGTSIRGKSKVSHLANKKLKSLLNMGALSAVRVDKEINSYYERKIAEGKNPMSVLNAVRNKLVGRVFATVKRGTPYVPLMNYRA